MSSTHNVPWLRGKALAVFFTLGGRMAIGDQVRLKRSAINKGNSKQLLIVAHRLVCRVTKIYPNRSIVDIRAFGPPPVEVSIFPKRVLMLRRLSCLTNTKK